MTDSHMKLCISEHIKDYALPCQFCSKDSNAYASDGDGWICELCIGEDEK